MKLYRTVSPFPHNGFHVVNGKATTKEIGLPEFMACPAYEWDVYAGGGQYFIKADSQEDAQQKLIAYLKEDLQMWMQQRGLSLEELMRILNENTNSR